MNILLISECTKRALTETRRIIDQFAERCGATAWQTAITQQGLNTLRKLLKKTARKNTAVACHWIRGKDNTELLWIIGNAGKFNVKGAVPTNITQKNILRQQDENDWHTLEGIKILAVIAALFHDFGKATKRFQKKLKNTLKQLTADPYRHEWISLRLFQAFVADATTDEQWLKKLAALDKDMNNAVEAECIKNLIRDGLDKVLKNPFETLPPAAKAVAWLILTHHFLPQKKDNINIKNFNLNSLTAEWNNANNDVTKEEIKECWNLEKLAFSSKQWRKRASYWGEQALKYPQLLKTDWLNDIYSMHLARLSLMLADHHYSSLPAQPNLGDAEFNVYANTDKTKNLKQKLDEHLIGVAKHTNSIVKNLPTLEKDLPRITRHKGFKKRTINPLFLWQNHAYDLANAIQERTAAQGFFGVNMASTGCGKTFANARIMYGLANPQLGARFCIALGLRTLTLQTGQAYRDRLKLQEDDLAVLVGSAAIKELFELNNKQANNDIDEEKLLKNCGSESAASLLSENAYVDYEGTLATGRFEQWLDDNYASGNNYIRYENNLELPALKQQFHKNHSANALLAAPILVCTVDHLIGATEGTKGGKQIIPMLRLMSSDLVLDEPDDFNMDDLPALTRLVHWAGMLGSRVLLSSATLPPALIEGLFIAYKEGRKLYQNSRGLLNQPVNVCCAWFDEYHLSTTDHAEAESFAIAHHQFVTNRLKELAKAKIRRRAVIKSLDISANETSEIRQQFAASIYGMLHELHQHHHSIDPVTQKKVSFGIVRMANIDPLIDVAQHLFTMQAQADHQILLCCYHARHPLLVRADIEKMLDKLLNRNDEQAIFADKKLRNILDNTQQKNVVFVVLASPVAEVGRDHDYDWAIIEPSSMRSIIQLAGRVLRHRIWFKDFPNIYLLNTNLKKLENKTAAVAYYWPGFEYKGSCDQFVLESHELEKILTPEQYLAINAAPRIMAAASLNARGNLADLEHARLKTLMLSDENESAVPVNYWWNTQAILAGQLQRQTQFRKSRQKNRFALLMEDEDAEFNYFDMEGIEPKQNNKLFEKTELQFNNTIKPWQNAEYPELIKNLAAQLEMNVLDCSKRFGWVDLEFDENNPMKWRHHPILGFRRDK